MTLIVQAIGWHVLITNALTPAKCLTPVVWLPSVKQVVTGQFVDAPKAGAATPMFNALTVSFYQPLTPFLQTAHTFVPIL